MLAKKTKSNEQKLQLLITKYGFKNHTIIWEDGDPVDTILKICKENIVDLLVAGGLEKENIFQYYLGSISREICRKAKCSVLMFREPSIKKTQFKKIVVSTIDHPKTSHTIGAAVYFANHQKAEELFLLKEVELPGFAMSVADKSTVPEADKIKHDLLEEENKKIDEILHTIDKGDLKIHRRNLVGKPGYTISQYSKKLNADLLVINSPDTHLTILHRIITHDIEYVLSNLPRNVLIIHARV